jgi:hypothetical protein
MPSHRAIALISDPARQAQIRELLPDFSFTWALELDSAIQAAADLRPSFLLADIDGFPGPWPEIALGLQSNPATRRIPMLAIAQKADPASQKRAAAAGLNGPYAYEMLAQYLPDWVERRARVWDEAYYASLAKDCTGALSDLAQEGARLFDAQDYWEAHEVLEHAWMEVRPAPIGELYRSILQVGVAYYQIQRGNYKGALKMFLRSVQWLDPLPDHCQGVDVAQFKRDAAAARAHLEALGPEKIAQFDPAYFKALPMVGG